MKIKFNNLILNQGLEEIDKFMENLPRFFIHVEARFTLHIRRLLSRGEEFSREHELRNSLNPNLFRENVNLYPKERSISTTYVVDFENENTFPVLYVNTDIFFRYKCHIKENIKTILSGMNYYPEFIFKYSFVVLAIIDNKWAYVKYQFNTEQELNSHNSLMNSFSADYSYKGFETIINIQHIYIESVNTNVFIRDYKKQKLEEQQMKERFSNNLKEKKLRELEELNISGSGRNRIVFASTPTDALSPIDRYLEQLRNNQINFAEEFRQQYMLDSDIHSDMAEEMRRQYARANVESTPIETPIETNIEPTIELPTTDTQLNNSGSEVSMDRIRAIESGLINTSAIRDSLPNAIDSNDLRFMANGLPIIEELYPYRTPIRGSFGTRHSMENRVNGLRADTIIVDDFEF